MYQVFSTLDIYLWYQYFYDKLTDCISFITTSDGSSERPDDGDEKHADDTHESHSSVWDYFGDYMSHFLVSSESLCPRLEDVYSDNR